MLFSLLSSSSSSIFCQLAYNLTDRRAPWFCQVAPIWHWRFLFFLFLLPFLDRWVSASWAKMQVATLIPLAEVLEGQLIFTPGSMRLSSTWGKSLHFHKLLRGVSNPAHPPPIRHRGHSMMSFPHCWNEMIHLFLWASGDGNELHANKNISPSGELCSHQLHCLPDVKEW